MNKVNIIRIFAIALSLFIGIFALDSKSIIEFLMHLIPSFIILGITALSWYSLKYTGLLFVMLGMISIFFFHSYRNIAPFLILSLPLIIIGVFFYVSYYSRVNKKIVKGKK